MEHNKSSIYDASNNCENIYLSLRNLKSYRYPPPYRHPPPFNTSLKKNKKDRPSNIIYMNSSEIDTLKYNSDEVVEKDKKVFSKSVIDAALKSNENENNENNENETDDFDFMDSDSNISIDSNTSKFSRESKYTRRNKKCYYCCCFK